MRTFLLLLATLSFPILAQQPDSSLQVVVMDSEPDECSQAIKMARNDAAIGDYQLIYADLPEFSNAMNEILFIEYHIRVVSKSREHSIFCSCYTNEMKLAIEKKYGSKIWADAAEKAVRVPPHDDADSSGVR